MAIQLLRFLLFLTNYAVFMVSLQSRAYALFVSFVHLYYLIPLKDTAKGVRKSTLSLHISHFILVLHVLLDFWLYYYFFFVAYPNQQRILGKLLAVFSFSIVSSSVVQACHQLFHSEYLIYRVFSWLTLIRNFKVFYYISHIQSHHKDIGTSKDPVTAVKGLGVYHYCIRVLVHEAKTVYYKSKLLFLLLTLAQLLYFYLLPHELKLPCLVVGLLINFYVQASEYIQHYGLRNREERSDAITANCAWDSDSFIANSTVFNLCRHTDHHRNSSKIYPQLQLDTSNYVYPYGYPAVMTLALYPQEWMKAVDPLLPPVHQNRAEAADNLRTAIIYANLKTAALFIGLTGLLAYS